MTLAKHLLPFAAAAVLLLHASARAQGEPGAPAAPPAVPLTVTVQDAKRQYLVGLDREAFAVYENDAPREITSFSADPAPVSMGLIFDMSSSVTLKGAPLVDIARQEVFEIVRGGDRASDYFVMGFNDKAHLLADWTRDPGAVARAINALPSVQGKESGKTLLYDALYAGLERVGRGAHAKRVLFLVTDGSDSGSRRDWKEVQRLAAETGALVYALVLHRETTPGLDRMWKVSRASGGWSWPVAVPSFMYSAGGEAAKREVKAALTTLALELRNQYMLSFRPAGASAGGELRRIVVKVRTPQKPDKPFAARAREGYFPPTQ